MAKIFETHEEVLEFIAALNDTTPKWKIVDSEAENAIVEGCESLTDRAAYVWIMDNQPHNEDGTGSAKYGMFALDNANADMPWLAE
jgi:hypothetical protein